MVDHEAWARGAVMSATVQIRLSDLEEAELDACVVMLVGLIGRWVSRPEA